MVSTGAANRRKGTPAIERLSRRLVVTESGCWEWQGYRGVRGHGQILGDDGRITGTHRVAWAAANGPIPKGAMVRHRCDNAPCCNPDHLELGTHADNMADMWDRGRAAVGMRHPGAVLSDEQVREIRATYDPQANPGRGARKYRSNAEELGEKYGVSAQHIRDVARGKFRRRVE